MENQMNNENNNNNFEHLMEILRKHPGFENCSEAELQNLAASIKEMALLLYELEKLERLGRE